MKKRKLKITPPKNNPSCKLMDHVVHRAIPDLSGLELVATKERDRINWAESILNIPYVWRQTQGEGVKVAILDTGIDMDHPDFEKAIIATKDFTGEGIEDGNGHGTHCAGIVGARLNNVGFVGVAPKSQLMIGKVLDNEGYGSENYKRTIKGIYWAIDNDADIISMSLGGGASNHELYKAIQYALYNGVFVICAAGNWGTLYSNSVTYPGKYGGVITVASHDEYGRPSGFSSRGGEVDVMAPGSRIWSTYKNGGYAELSGTSMATPFVAGLAALIAAKHKNSDFNETALNNTEDMRNHLLRMATHPGYYDSQSGYGPLQPFMYFFK